MLELHNIHAHYGLSHVVQGIDLGARAGEVVGIFGRNGVGKTTLLKTIAGWLKPTEGEIRIDGKRIDGASPDGICRAGVSFVPEDRRIFPGLTVEENLALGFLQVPRRAATGNRAALDTIYRRFPRLQERRRQLGTTLSGGEQQMLAIARAIVGGSASDVVTRVVLDRMGTALGQRFVVDNRPGAGGNIGTAVAAKADADGYTLLLGASGPMAANRSLFKTLGFDPDKDFSPIGLFAHFPNIVVASTKLPVNSVAELVV